MEEPERGPLNLRHVRYFLAVCEHGSFRAAAAALNLAQSALSRRIADIECMLEVELFERRPRGVALTPAGEALRLRVTQISDTIDAAHEALARYKAGQAGTLTVGFFGTTVRLGFVPELIGAFREAFPDIALELSLSPQAQPHETNLVPLDLAFFEHGEQGDERRVSACVDKGEYMLAMPRGHRLARYATVPFAAACAEDLITFPRVSNPQIYDRLVQEAARLGQALRIIHETDSEVARLAFAAAGMGVALSSPLAINHDQAFEVEYRPFADLELPFDLWVSAKAGAPLALQFIDLTVDLVSRLGSMNRV